MTNRQIHDRVRETLRHRYVSERIFRSLGLGSVIFGILFIIIIFGSLIYYGHLAFVQTFIRLDIVLPSTTQEKVLRLVGKKDHASFIALTHILSKKCVKNLAQLLPKTHTRQEKRKMRGLLSTRVPYDLARLYQADPDLITQNIEFDALADDDVDQFYKGKLKVTNYSQSSYRFGTTQASWVEDLRREGRVFSKFNRGFFVNSDSREPEQAGILGAFSGSLLTLSVAFILSFPLGVATAIYLQEIAPRNRWTEFIDVSINNLAAVPSIIFGLLGLVILLGVFGMPRSTPLVGGVVLAIMTLPTIVVASRSALQNVPFSIKEAALSVGASRLQTIFHHSLPMAFPGILTGGIIGMAQALGETAPLLMIGMVAFIADVPQSFTDPATVLPVQIFLWADSPERAFTERTAGAILILLGFLILMNLIAVLLRKKFEKHTL